MIKQNMKDKVYIGNRLCIIENISIYGVFLYDVLDGYVFVLPMSYAETIIKDNPETLINKE